MNLAGIVPFLIQSALAVCVWAFGLWLLAPFHPNSYRWILHLVRPRTPPAPSAPLNELPPNDYLVGIGVGAVCGLFKAAIVAPTIMVDSVREMLDVRDCLEFGQCPVLGPPSSFGGFCQGVMVYQFRVLARLAHLSFDGTMWLLLALCGLAAAVVYLTARRFLGRVPSVAIAAAFFLLANEMSGIRGLFSVALVPLPIALVFESLAAAAETRSTRAAAAAGMFVSLTAAAHWGAWLFAPFLGMVLATFAERPLRALGAAAAAALSVWVLTAPTVFALDLQRTAELPFIVPLVVGYVLGLVLAARARRFSDRVPDRAALAVAVATTGMLLTFIVGAVLLHRSVLPQYVVLSLPGLLVLEGAAACLFRRRLLSASTAFSAATRVWIARAVPLAYVFFTFHYLSGQFESGPDPATPTWKDIERISPLVYDRDVRFQDLPLHLVGPRAREFLVGLSVTEAAAHPGPAHLQSDLLALTASRRDVPTPPPATWQVVPGSHGRAIVLRWIEPFLDRSSVRGCFTPADPRAGGPHWFPVPSGEDPDPSERDMVTPFGRRAHPGIEKHLPPELITFFHASRSPFRMAYEVPVLRPAGAPPHVVRVPASWRVQLTDATALGGPPATSTTTLAPQPGRRTTVTVWRDFSSEVEFTSGNAEVPTMIELLPEEAELDALLGDF